MYYSSFGLLALIIHFIINIDALKKVGSTINTPTRKRYRLFLFVLALYYVSDIAWGLLYEKQWITATYIDTVLYFIAMGLSILLWTRFVVSFITNKGRFGRFLLIGGWLIFGFQVTTLILNLFFPLVFSFDAAGEYHTGKLRYASLVLQILLFIITSIYTLVISSKTKGKEQAHNRIIGLSGIIMSVFILLQSLYPLLPLYAVGCLLATCIIHTFVTRDMIIEHYHQMKLNEQLAYRDGLTGVKNKLAYLDALKDLELRFESGKCTEFGAVVFDLNGLKSINDRLGHVAGDEYIKTASTLICHIYKHSPIFRIGGDEFVAILERDDYENRNSLLETFNQTIDDNQKTGKVVVSCGMAVYNPEEDRDYNDVFSRADQLMYDRKNHLKSSDCQTDWLPTQLIEKELNS